MSFARVLLYCNVEDSRNRQKHKQAAWLCTSACQGTFSCVAHNKDKADAFDASSYNVYGGHSYTSSARMSSLSPLDRLRAIINSSDVIQRSQFDNYRMVRCRKENPWTRHFVPVHRALALVDLIAPHKRVQHHLDLLDGKVAAGTVAQAQPEGHERSRVKARQVCPPLWFELVWLWPDIVIPMDAVDRWRDIAALRNHYPIAGVHVLTCHPTCAQRDVSQRSASRIHHNM